MNQKRKKTIECILKPIFYLILITFSSSCATHRGYLGANAVLVDNHFKILGVAIGEAESVKILGFGGLKKDALVFDVKNCSIAGVMWITLISF